MQTVRPIVVLYELLFILLCPNYQRMTSREELFVWVQGFRDITAPYQEDTIGIVHLHYIGQ